MRNIRRKLKKYPELLGISAICLLVAVIFVYKLEARRQYIDPGIITEDMARESTVGGFTKPEDIVKYMIEALKKDDLDMGLRGFPIDEKILGLQVGKELDFLGEFSTNITYMPSQWREFVPISSAEITKDYTETFNSMKTYLAGKTADVDQVMAIMPKEQLDTQYQRDSQRICEIWGADGREEIIAKLNIDGKDYAVCMTLLRYGEFWKVDSFTSSLTEEQKKESIWPCSEQEYDQLTDKTREKELTELLEGKDRASDGQEIADPEKELLPSNYVVYNSTFEKDPVKTIEKFILCIQKNDLSEMMIYTDLYGEEDPFTQELSDLLITQGELSEQIQTFYYYLMGNDFATIKTVSLDSLGMTGEEISSCMNLNEIMYLEVLSVLNIEQDEYAAFYFFNGKHYMSGFTMKEYDQGWKIENLSCSAMGLEDGQVKELTEKQCYDIIEEYTNGK